MDKVIEEIRTLITEPMNELEISVEKIEWVEENKNNFLKIELDKIKINECILNKPNLPQVAIDLANEAIHLCNESIRNLKALNKPFSGMLIAQI